jgi:cell wall-associated NlpC family hydrolase
MKRFLPALLLILLAFSIFSQTISSHQLTTFSRKFLGVKYRYGKASPKAGFDCSGFLFYVFNYFQIPVPRTSIGFSKCTKIIHPDSCKAGDIIVFTGTNPKKHSPEHVGMVLSGSGDNIKFIHSSSSKKKSGVKISTFKESPSYKKRFIKIVRVTDRLK